jgi:hypothetical protein
MLLFSFFIFISGVVLICGRRIHLVTIFLGMEFSALGVFSAVGSLSAYNRLFVLLVVICIRVSEAAIMLSLIVIMTRMYGNDRCINLMTDPKKIVTKCILRPHIKTTPEIKMKKLKSSINSRT